MLTMRKPIQPKSLSPMKRFSGDSLEARIRANYQQLQAQFTPEDLFHILSQPPEVYLAEGGVTNLVTQNQSVNRQEIKLELVSNLINRMLMLEKEQYTYQDSVYVQNLLQKLGIKNTQEFIRQVQYLQQDTKNVRQLLKLYQENGTELRELVEQVADGQKTGRDSRDGQMASEKTGAAEQGSGTQGQPKQDNYLHQQIFKRLHTSEVYERVQEVSRGYQQQSQEITRQELATAEYTRTAVGLRLQSLENHVLKKETPLLLRRTNVYEEGQEAETEITKESIRQQLSRAVLLNLTDNLYQLRNEKIQNSDDFWFRWNGSFETIVKNTMERFTSLHTSEQPLQKIEEKQEYLKQVNQIREREVQQLGTLVEQLALTLHRDEYKDLSDTEVLNQRNTQNYPEVQERHNTEHYQEILNQQNTESYREVRNQQNTENYEEVLNQRNTENYEEMLNQQNIEKYEELIRKEQELPRIKSISIDRRKAQKDSLRALENPQEVIEEYLNTTTELERLETRREEIFREGISEETKEMLRRVEEMRPGTVPGFGKEVTEVTEKVQLEHQKSAELLAELMSQEQEPQIQEIRTLTEQFLQLELHSTQAAQADSPEEPGRSGSSGTQEQAEQQQNRTSGEEKQPEQPQGRISKLQKTTEQKLVLLEHLQQEYNTRTSKYRELTKQFFESQTIEKKESDRTLLTSEQTTEKEIHADTERQTEIQKRYELQNKMLQLQMENRRDYENILRELQQELTENSVSVAGEDHTVYVQPQGQAPAEKTFVSQTEVLQTESAVVSERERLQSEKTALSERERLQSEQTVLVQKERIQEKTEILQQKRELLQSLQEAVRRVEKNNSRRTELYRNYTAVPTVLQEGNSEVKSEFFRENTEEIRESLKDTLRETSESRQEFLREREHTEAEREFLRQRESTETEREKTGENAPNISVHQEFLQYVENNSSNQELQQKMQHLEELTQEYEIQNFSRQENRSEHSVERKLLPVWETIQEETENRREYERTLREIVRETERLTEYRENAQTQIRELEQLTERNTGSKTYEKNLRELVHELRKEKGITESSVVQKVKVPAAVQQMTLEYLKTAEEITTLESGQVPMTENKIQRTIETLLPTLPEKQVRMVNVSQETPKLQFIHKPESGTIDESVLEDIRNEARKIQRTENTQEEVISGQINRRQKINTQSVQTVNQQTEQINKLVSRNIQKQINAISDQVYSKLEKKLSNERKRRGY